MVMGCLDVFQEKVTIFLCMGVYTQDADGVRAQEEVLGAGPRQSAPLAGVVHAVQGRELAPARHLQPEATSLRHAPAGIVAAPLSPVE